MSRLLWLDDMRCPFYGTWVEDYCPIDTDNIVVEWVKSYSEFVNWIEKNGLPDAICFDHDLGKLSDGTELNGYDCAKWLVEYCIDHECDVPTFNCQSSNPAGRDNIMSYLKNYHNLRFNS